MYNVWCTSSIAVLGLGLRVHLSAKSNWLSSLDLWTFCIILLRLSLFVWLLILSLHPPFWLMISRRLKFLNHITFFSWLVALGRITNLDYVQRSSSLVLGLSYVFSTIKDWGLWIIFKECVTRFCSRFLETFGVSSALAKDIEVCWRRCLTIILSGRELLMRNRRSYIERYWKEVRSVYDFNVFLFGVL